MRAEGESIMWQARLISLPHLEKRDREALHREIRKLATYTLAKIDDVLFTDQQLTDDDRLTMIGMCCKNHGPDYLNSHPAYKRWLIDHGFTMRDAVARCDEWLETKAKCTNGIPANVENSHVRERIEQHRGQWSVFR